MHVTSSNQIMRLPLANPPQGMPRILPHVIYDDVGAAIEWLTRVFGFRERTWVRHTAADGVIGRTQMDVVDAVITLGQPSVHGGSPQNGVSMMLYVYVDNVAEHCERTRAAGARIVVELADRPWGDRTYQVMDLEGHPWTFAEHVEEVESIQSHLDE
jgi:uncharacterized glyoxalase superfamily protein PhnB